MRDYKAERLSRYVKSTIGLEKAGKGPPFYWASIPLCIIDSIFSIQAKYEAVVRPLVNRWCDSFSPRWAGEQEAKPKGNVGPTILDFIGILEDRLSRGAKYKDLFQNSQRTSSTNGILKADAVHRFAKALVDGGVNQFDDLGECEKLRAAEIEVKRIPGQKSGITFTYFLMLAGDEGFVKGDTHVRRFVNDALGLDWTNLLPVKQAIELVSAAAAELKRECSEITTAKLDYAIWNYQRTRTKQSPSGS
jgi:hypothetical protein